MRFGLNLGNGGPSADPRTMADLAELAEQSGWDGVFLEDYIIYQNQTGTPTYDPWVCLAAMAMRTQRIRLGTTVTPLPRRRVAKLGAETIALDHLSGGRLTLGVGLGDAWDVALANLCEQTDTQVRAAMLDEALDVLGRAVERRTIHPSRPVLPGARGHARATTGADTAYSNLDRWTVSKAGPHTTSSTVGWVMPIHLDELLGYRYHPARLDARRCARVLGDGWGIAS